MNLYSSEDQVEDIKQGQEYQWYGAVPNLIPSVTFQTRVRDESLGGDNPYRWEEVNTWDIFASRKVLVFSLPGAFTPTCSTMQLPQFERLAGKFYEKGIEAIYCISVNDAFVMNAWAKQQGLKEVNVLPDGNGKFTEDMGMLVSKQNLGFGNRSWRYAMVVDNGRITDFFMEAGKEDDHELDPYAYTNPNYILGQI